MKKTPLCCIFIILFFSCSKITPGFLSPTLGYTDKTIVCKRGLAFSQSEKINFDGSTSPVTFKLLAIHDSSGGKAPAEFDQHYDVVQFKPGESFDPAKDTTVDLLNAKRETKSLTPFDFNTSTGQFTFNHGCANLPLGSYSFDITATNVHGTRTIPNAGTLVVEDPTDDDLFEQTAAAFANGFSDASGAATPIKAPVLTFTKVSADGARIIMKIVDKNDVPFNPAAGEVIIRGGRPSFVNYAKFHPAVFTDTAMVCDFEVAPFPLAHYVDATAYDWGYLMYYRIPSQFVSIDGMPAPTGYSANPVFSFQIKLEGTYIVQIKMQDVVHR